MKIHPLHDTQGEQKDQRLVLSDQQGNILGYATRKECHHGDGKTHLAFLALLFDKNGEIILTKRSEKKSLWAHFWDASVVSHVLSGETPEQATRRRGKEELGVDVSFQRHGAFYYFAKHGNSAENEYCYYLTGKTKAIIVPNPVEISEILMMKKEEFLKKIKEQPEEFTPWLRIAVEKFPVY